jgi:hypothetical protein
MSKLSYSTNGGYLIPNLVLTEADSLPLGKYGRMRKTYLKEHRSILFNTLLLSGKLVMHLQEIDQIAYRRLNDFMAAQARAEKLTERTKVSNPLAWTGQMNALKARVEEMILAELIYA